MRKLEDPSFLPVLRPLGWPGRAVSACRRLAKRDRQSPYVAYGWDSPEAVDFLTREMREAEGWSLDAVNRAAIANLARRDDDAPWKKQRVDGYGSIGTVLIREGGEHTAAGVLRPRLMRRAQDAIGADPIAVSIPCRFAMWACDPALLVAGDMLTLSREQYEEAARDRRDPVTPHAILVSGGKVIGMVMPKASADDEGDGALDVDAMIEAFRETWDIPETRAPRVRAPVARRRRRF